MIQVTLEKLSLGVRERSIYGLSFVLENEMYFNFQGFQCGTSLIFFLFILKLHLTFSNGSFSP